MLGNYRPSFTETLRDAFDIQKLVVDLITSAKQEILMLLFPNTTIGDIFLSRGHEDDALKIIQLLKYAELQDGIRVRILASEVIYTQIVKRISGQQKTDRRQEYEKLEQDGKGLIGIRKQKGTFEIHLAGILRQQQQQRLQTKVSFLVVDSKVSLVEEELKTYNNKDKNDSNQTLFLATYSNSESAVLAYISIFETFWTQTELKMKMG